MTIKKLPIIINEKYKQTKNDDFFPFFYLFHFAFSSYFLFIFLVMQKQPRLQMQSKLVPFLFDFLFPDLDYTHLYDM